MRKHIEVKIYQVEYDYHDFSNAYEAMIPYELKVCESSDFNSDYAREQV